MCLHLFVGSVELTGVTLLIAYMYLPLYVGRLCSDALIPIPISGNLYPISSHLHHSGNLYPIPSHLHHSGLRLINWKREKLHFSLLGSCLLHGPFQLSLPTSLLVAQFALWVQGEITDLWFEVLLISVSDVIDFHLIYLYLTTFIYLIYTEWNEHTVNKNVSIPRQTLE